MLYLNIKNSGNYRRIQIIFLGSFVGIFLAILLAFSPGSVFVFSLAFLFGLLIWFWSPRTSERKFLIIIFIIGFSLRIIGVLLAHIIIGLSNNYYNCESLGQRTIAIFGDDGYYTIRSGLMARYWLGEAMPQEFVRLVFYPSYGRSGFLYILSFFHCIFGFSPVSSTFINCFLGTVTGIIVYFIAKEIFTIKIAKLSAIFVIFFPSLFLWSLSNLKDSSIIFSIVVALWSFINLQRRKRFCYLIFLILALCFLTTLRYELGLGMIVTVFFSYLCVSRLSFVKKLCICLVFIAALQAFLFTKNTNLKTVVLQKLTYLLMVHRGMVITGGSVYKLFSENFYLYTPVDMHLSDYAGALLRGWIHLFLEPFLWRIPTKQILFSYPQIVLWYMLIPFAFLGMMIALRHNWRLSCVLCVYFLIIGSLLAMLGGNIGTNFRHRDVLTPVFLVFASAGLMKMCGFYFNFGSKK